MLFLTPLLTLTATGAPTFAITTASVSTASVSAASAKPPQMGATAPVPAPLYFLMDVSFGGVYFPSVLTGPALWRPLVEVRLVGGFNNRWEAGLHHRGLIGPTGDLDSPAKIAQVGLHLGYPWEFYTSAEALVQGYLIPKADFGYQWRRRAATNPEPDPLCPRCDVDHAVQVTSHDLYAGLGVAHRWVFIPGFSLELGVLAQANFPVAQNGRIIGENGDHARRFAARQGDLSEPNFNVMATVGLGMRVHNVLLAQMPRSSSGHFRSTHLYYGNPPRRAPGPASERRR